MKRADLYKVEAVLKSVSMLKEGVKSNFSYKVSKNRELIQNEIKHIDEARAKLKEFYTEQQALAKKYCTKDAEGNPVITNNMYQGIDETPDSEFSKEFGALKLKYKEHIDDVDAFLAGDVGEEIKWRKIALSDCPDGISGFEMEVISFLIDDGETPEKK